MRTVFLGPKDQLLPTPSERGATAGMLCPVDAFVGTDGYGLAVLVLRPREMAAMEYSASIATLNPDVGL